MIQLIAILFAFSLFATPIVERRLPTDAVLELANELGINTDEGLIEATQEKWLRKAGKERWEMGLLSPDESQIVIQWGQKQGLYSPWLASKRSYDKALILGATVPYMKKRLQTLVNLWKSGARFQEIVWLTGKRPLDQTVDQFPQCKNESEASHIIWEEGNLPDEMKKLKVTFVEVEMKPKGRPTTEDTILLFVEKNPLPCSCLFVSDQPFCGYQYAVIEGALPKEFSFEVIGDGVDPLKHPLAASVTLDVVARWIYQEMINQLRDNFSSEF